MELYDYAFRELEALTAYAAGTGDWNGVVTAFVDGWATEAALAE